MAGDQYRIVIAHSRNHVGMAFGTQEKNVPVDFGGDRHVFEEFGFASSDNGQFDLSAASTELRDCLDGISHPLGHDQTPDVKQTKGPVGGGGALGGETARGYDSR